MFGLNGVPGSNPSGTGASVVAPQERQAGAAAAFHAGDDGGELGPLDFVVARVERVIVFAEGRIAAMATHRLGGHCLVRVATERASAAFATEAAQAGAFRFGLVRAVGLVTFRRRQAGIVWRLRRRRQCRQPSLKRRDARERLAQLRRLRLDEGILLGGGKLGRVWCRRAHTDFRIESLVTASTGFWAAAAGPRTTGGSSSYSPGVIPFAARVAAEYPVKTLAMICPGDALAICAPPCGPKL